jgi:hypothetical protein
MQIYITHIIHPIELAVALPLSASRKRSLSQTHTHPHTQTEFEGTRRDETRATGNRT